MKTALLFLLLLGGSSYGLWAWGRDEEPAPNLPEQYAELPPPVLFGRDLADEFGNAEISGSLRALEGVVLRVFEGPAVKYYLRIDRVGREDDTPRLEGVSCAVFDKPKGTQPQLRAMFRAPRVEAAIATLLRAGRDDARPVQLTGGVTAQDAAGRTLAEADSVRFDLATNRVAVEGPVRLTHPDKDVVVSGNGLEADLDLRSAKLARDIDLRLLGTRITAGGPATISQTDDKAPVDIVLEGGVHVAHVNGDVRGDVLYARFRRKGEKFELESATVEGTDGVTVALHGKLGRGLEIARLAKVRVVSQRRLTAEGPISARWRGKLDALGMGMRELSIRAGALEIDGDEKGVRTVELRSGVEIDDTRGAGKLRAQRLLFLSEGRRVRLSGEVLLETPEWRVDAERVEIDAPSDNATSVRITGRKEVSYIADGNLGPLGTARRGRVTVTCAAPMTVERNGETIDVQLIRAVTIRVGGDASLKCRSLRARMKGGKLVSLSAETGVDVRAPQGTLTADELDVNGETLTATGSPAVLVRPGEGTLHAKRVVRESTGAFRAAGDVFAQTANQMNRWTIRCDSIEGEPDKKTKRPVRIVARGSVRADGPEARRAFGDVLTYDVERKSVSLLGSPARAEQGKTIRFSAPTLAATLNDKGVERIESGGVANAEYRTPDKDITRWVAEFRGTARFVGRKITIADGGVLTGFAKDGAKRLSGKAGRLVVHLDDQRRLRRIEGRRGVELASSGKRAATVTARDLDYEIASKQVILKRDARVRAAGWPRTAKFGKVVFVVLPDGVDLKRASEIEILDQGK